MGLDEVRRNVAEMLDELNLLIWESEEYGLSAPDAIIKLLGVSYVLQLDSLRQSWENQKQALYSAAVEVLGIKKLTYSDKAKFVKAVETFCESNEPMSKQYIETVFELFCKSMDKHKLSPTVSEKVAVKKATDANKDGAEKAAANQAGMGEIR